MSTPTPRTDAEAQTLIDADEVVPADFARTLERELHESRNAERLARVQLGNEREKVQRLVEINEFVGSAQLKAEREKVRVLRAELTNIAAANPAHWGDEMDQFMPWAQSRSRHTLVATEDTP
jgi:cellulase/cellobiase CelA1